MAVIDELTSDLATLLADDRLPSAKKKFSEAQLAIFLRQALDDLNLTPPITSWDYDGAVSANFGAALLVGGVIFALLHLQVFEIGREFTYNVKGVGITFDRSGKYAALLGQLLTAWETFKARKAYTNAGTVFPCAGVGFAERLRGGSYGLQGLLSLLPGYTQDRTVTGSSLGR